MSEWRITRLRGKLALTFEKDGKRHRHSLGTDDPRQAYLLAPAIYAEVTRPAGRTVKDLWDAYTIEKHGKAVLVTMKYTWRALNERFGSRNGEGITQEDCKAHIKQRRLDGIADGTIHTELGHLRTVLVWAEKTNLIAKAPQIERPSKPEPKDRYMTRDEAQLLLSKVKVPHLKVAMHLMLATAARVTAVLELTWDRVDFERRLIFLRDTEDKTKRKGRAVVPMNNTLFSVLKEAKTGSFSDHVVEWAGKPVKSLKRGIATAANEAKLTGISAHVFRHSASVWMIEAGIPMSEVSQYLGHSSTRITERVYAKYSPDYLRSASEALELCEKPSLVSQTTKRA